MADIVYTIDYDESTGLRTSQSIEKIGKPDRIRFQTNTKTTKVALKRDRVKSRGWPFGKTLPDPYPVPLASAKPKWIKVVRSGSKYHYICGYIEDDGKFEAWPVRPPNLKGKQTKSSQPQSLPFPT